ncbi:Predicted membrane protein (DUF2207) [Weissella viridescens]|uniref:Predicted membrane protein (DUF2207) n=1 Tax=Weissella viridescens TaxID=1629 RepID=A0A380NX58_WEIVI|nr:Predicted membrane protein (DUF2207) [Weissella viridescens]
MLDQIGRMSEREIEEVVLWDRLLAYAVILDEGKTVAKELEKLDLQPIDAAPVNELLVAFALIGPYQIRVHTAVASTSSGSNMSLGPEVHLAVLADLVVVVLFNLKKSRLA